MTSVALNNQAADTAPADRFSALQRNQPSQGISRLIWFSVALGALLRLVQYLRNRSLWLDESSLALNILHRSYSGLLEPLDYHQGAPVGFLMLEKLAVRSLGAGEYALRLAPLVAGLVSLFLF
jgi:hypothetical protein